MLADAIAGVHRCGAIVSSIIEKDQAGNPKGVAVIEFEDEVGRRTALTLSGRLLAPNDLHHRNPELTFEAQFDIHLNQVHIKV